MTAQPLPHPKVLASDQAADALCYSNLDLRHEPRWKMGAVHDLCERLLPGNLVIIGALTGNGKSSFLMTQAQHMEQSGIPVLYVPLEVDPFQMRRQWAAWECGLPWERVAMNEWDDLPYGSYGRFQGAVERLTGAALHFPPDRRITLGRLHNWIAWGVEQAGIRCVMIDHFHRMAIGGGDGYRVKATDAARELKDLARTYNLPIICAAQLNRTGAGVLDRYIPPRLDRLKETAGLAEEADVVLMLSRALKANIDAADLKLLNLGLKAEHQFAQDGVMLATCRKHRLLNSALDRTVKLAVEHGRVGDFVEAGPR